MPDNPDWLFERLISRNSQPIEEIQKRINLVQDYIHETESIICEKVYTSFHPDSWDKTFKIIENIIFKL